MLVWIKLLISIFCLCSHSYKVAFWSLALYTGNKRHQFESSPQNLKTQLQHLGIENEPSPLTPLAFPNTAKHRQKVSSGKKGQAQSDPLLFWIHSSIGPCDWWGVNWQPPHTITNQSGLTVSFPTLLARQLLACKPGPSAGFAASEERCYTSTKPGLLSSQLIQRCSHWAHRAQASQPKVYFAVSLPLSGSGTKCFPYHLLIYDISRVSKMLHRSNLHLSVLTYQ